MWSWGENPELAIHNTSIAFISILRCSLNCFEKLSPKIPLKISSVCTDCLPGIPLSYRWRLYHTIPKLGKFGEETYDENEMTDLESKATTGINKANIALKENVLTLGERYLLRISAWKPGGNEGESYILLIFISPNKELWSNWNSLHSVAASFLSLLGGICICLKIC